MTQTQQQILYACRLFTGVEEAWLRAALEDPRCRCRSYGRDELIYAGKQFERSLGILLSGSIRVMRTTHDGRKMLVSRQLPGALFGMAVLFCDTAEFATQLLCETDCDVFFIDEPLLRELMQQRFEIAENYIRYLSGRIQFLNQKIAGLSAGDSIHKLSCWLLEHAVDGTAAIPAMSSLASQLNIGRASLYRAVEALEAGGIIRRSGKSMELLDPAQLRGLQQDDTLV